jgi:hypothetical protein
MALLLLDGVVKKYNGGASEACPAIYSDITVALGNCAQGY